MADSKEFGALTLKLTRLEAQLGPVGMEEALTVVGVQAQGDMIEAAVAALGPDRMFSGWKRLGRLETDLRVAPSEFTIIPKPYGGWIVADKGRRPGSVAPSRRSRSTTILKTPWGPRTYTVEKPLKIGPSPGKNALTHGKLLIRQRSGKRMEFQVQKYLRKEFTGG